VYIADVLGDNAGDSDMRQADVSAIVLALVTLGGTTEIGSFLFLAAPPMGAKTIKEVREVMLHYRVKLCQCKHGFIPCLTKKAIYYWLRDKHYYTCYLRFPNTKLLCH